MVSAKGLVKLGDVAKFTRGEGPQVIEREDRRRQIMVWASTRGRSLGDVVKDIMPRFEALKMPPGASLFYDGQIKQMNESNESMGTALLLGVVVRAGRAGHGPAPGLRQLLESGGRSRRDRQAFRYPPHSPL